jgi:hypothetical protein
MSPNDPYELLPNENDLDDLNEDTFPISPFYKGCLIILAILVILSLLVSSLL